MLACRHVSKTYRSATAAAVAALSDVTLDVPAGAFMLLGGPSGSGKTTLLALLGGLERPTSGQVLFAGRDLAAYSDAERARLRRRMGFVFQDFALIPGLPVWDNVTYHLIPRGVSRGERYRLAGAALERVGLGARRGARPAELSGGEQQRVAVARALAVRPELILADEPTSNLDDDAADVIIGLLRGAHAEGTTLVVAAHDPRLRALATGQLRLEAGRLVAGGAK